MCRRGACLASESSSIPIRGPKPLSVKGAFRRWKTYRGNGNFCQPLTGEKNEVKKEKKKKRFSLYLRQVAHPAGAYPPPPPPPTRISSGFPDTPFILLGGERLCESKLFRTRLQHIVPARPTLEPGLLDWESSVLTIRPPPTILTKIKLVKWENRKYLWKIRGWYDAAFRSRVGNPSVIEGQTAYILPSQTELWARCSTRSREIYGKYLTSLLAETKSRVIPATNFPLN